MEGATQQSDLLLKSRDSPQEAELDYLIPGLMTIVLTLLVAPQAIGENEPLGYVSLLLFTIKLIVVYCNCFFTSCFRRQTDNLRMPLILCFQVETFTPPLIIILEKGNRFKAILEWAARGMP